MRVLVVASLALVCLCGAPVAVAQVPPPELQADLEHADLPSLPEPAEDPQPAPELELPPAPAPPDPGRLSGAVGVFVRAFQVTGSSLLSEADVADLTEPWTGREITSVELTAVRDAITRAYIERGYVNSGAIIPDQDVSHGIVRVDVIEGSVTRVDVEGVRALRASYVRKRVRPEPDAPVHLPTLERRLQLLQQDERILRVHAQLLPGIRRGEAILSVAVEETSPWIAEAEVSNHNAASVGERTARARLGHASVFGFADRLLLDASLTRGLDDLEIRWDAPITRYDTTLGLRYRRANSDIVERPFEDDDVESESESGAITLSHPLWRTPSRQIHVGVTAEHRRSESFFQGTPFGFGITTDGKSTVRALRFFQSFTWRSRTRVLAAQSTFTLGDADARLVSGAAPTEGRFLAWLGQAQVVQRLPEGLLGALLVARADLQIAGDPLLSIEKFAVGGAGSVRGYRENALVRDNGVLGSLEVRVPVWRDDLGRDVLQIAPFFDFGKSWDEGHPDSLESIASLGAGLRWLPAERWLLEVYFAEDLRSSRQPGEHRNDALQYHGIHFRARLRY